MAIEKRKFEVTVSVDTKAKQAALRADLRSVIGTAVGNDKVVVKPVHAAKPVVAKKTTKKTAAKKATAKKTTRARKAA